MKTEKQTERIETKRFDLDEEKEILDLDGRLTVHEVKDLISQNVAILDLEKNASGEPRSVTVKRVLDNSVIFYSEDEEDIKRLMD